MGIMEGRGGSRRGVVTLSCASKEGLEQEEEFESDFGGCGKDQIKPMLGLAALGHGHWEDSVSSI